MAIRSTSVAKWVNVCMCMHALIIPKLGFLLLLLLMTILLLLLMMMTIVMVILLIDAFIVMMLITLDPTFGSFTLLELVSLVFVMPCFQNLQFKFHLELRTQF